MTRYIFIRTASLLASLLMVSAINAMEGKPVPFTATGHLHGFAPTDTVPPVKRTVEEKPAEEKPATTSLPVIKEVPKARKQIKPVALPSVPVKPVRIIKPVIKRVGNLIP